MVRHDKGDQFAGRSPARARARVFRWERWGSAWERLESAWSAWERLGAPQSAWDRLGAPGERLGGA